MGFSSANSQRQRASNNGKLSRKANIEIEGLLTVMARTVNCIWTCSLIAVVAALFGSELGCSGRGSGMMVHGDGAKYYIEAMKVRTQDEAKCLDLLDKSIAALPTESAYFHRGWIYAKQGKFDQAQENARAGLELEPTSTNLLWLDGELKKPADKRSFKFPPTVKGK